MSSPPVIFWGSRISSLRQRGQSPKAQTMPATSRVTNRALAAASAVAILATCFPGMAAEPAAAAAPSMTPRIGLALSGGGARGIAHVGVLKVLEELRVPIHCVT